MPTYKLLALDMDGTLLTSDKRISPRTLEAIRTATQHGFAVALSTGRAINELSSYRSQLAGTVRYASLLSGGHVYDLDTEQTIAVRPFDTDVALAVARQGLAEDAMVHILTTSTTAATPRDVDRMPAVGMGIYQEMFRSICTYIDDAPAYIEAHAGEICKVNLYHTSQESRMRSWERLSGIDAHLAFAEETSIESTPRGVTKAQGLELLCRYLGCTTAECVAVGDAPNDTDALSVAGLAVAMGNATDDILELADRVVADNDHDGIAELIEQLLA